LAELLLRASCFFDKSHGKTLRHTRTLAFAPILLYARTTLNKSIRKLSSNQRV
jgi:hypothetical protein